MDLGMPRQFIVDVDNGSARISEQNINSFSLETFKENLCTCKFRVFTPSFLLRAPCVYHFRKTGLRFKLLLLQLLELDFFRGAAERLRFQLFHLLLQKNMIFPEGLQLRISIRTLFNEIDIALIHNNTPFADVYRRGYSPRGVLGSTVNRADGG